MKTRTPATKTIAQKTHTAMDARKRARLKRKGWKVGTVGEFLGLTAAESEFIEMHLALSRCLRKRREHQRLTQTMLAKLLGSSQSRVAKMEAGDPSVSMDLLIQGLLTSGASRKDVARALSTRYLPA